MGPAATSSSESTAGPGGDIGSATEMTTAQITTGGAEGSGGGTSADSTGGEGSDCAPYPGPLRSGSTFYVATDGSDTRSCDEAMDRGTPRGTISGMGECVAPGDTVVVLPGIYNEAVRTTTDGAEGAPIRYLSEQKWGAQIAGVPEYTLAVWWLEADYIEIIGFEVTGNGSVGVSMRGSYGLAAENHVHHIQSPTCSDNVNSGLNGGPPGADFNSAVRNVVHDIANNCPEESAYAFYWGYRGGTIANNIAYRTMGYGIHLWHHPVGTQVLHNLVFAVDGHGMVFGGQGDEGDAEDLLIANNIIYGNNFGIRIMGNQGAGNVVRDNIFFANTGPSIGSMIDHDTLIENVMEVDPLLVDYQADGSGDYRLQAGSPAIDSGVVDITPLVEINVDHDGGPRLLGAGPDIGPYEFGANCRD